MSQSQKIHLDIQKHRSKPFGVLRSYVKDSDGKLKRTTVGRLNNLTLDQLVMIQASLQGKIVPRSDFAITSSKEYGASFVCLSLAKQIGLDKIIYSRPSEQWVKDCLAMIVGRIIFAGSKLSLTLVHKDSVLWEICGIPSNIDTVDVNKHCYDSMDNLLKRQEEIQKQLAKKHLTDGSLVLYDITSTYFEGEYSDSEIVKFGYNRDKKKGKQQIVIGLMCNKEGCPFAVEVFKGNTKDETTVLSKIKELKKTYSFNDLIFVGDRGMITKCQFDNINAVNENGEKENYMKIISALTHNDIKKLCERKVIQLSMFDVSKVVEVIDPENTMIRYGLCINLDIKAKDATIRTTLLGKTKEALDKIAESKRNNTKEQLGVRAGKVINKYGMGKFVVITEISDKKFIWHFDQEKIDREALYDGCYVVFTDVEKQNMTITEAVKNYKRLINVEQAFRNMKTVELELRPVYHRTDGRIRCHAFICMLSYYIMWHMNKKLSPLFKNDSDGKNQKYTFHHIIDRLKSIRKNKVSFCDVNTDVVTQLDDELKTICKLLEVNF
jgi:transposase